MAKSTTQLQYAIITDNGDAPQRFKHSMADYPWPVIGSIITLAGSLGLAFGRRLARKAEKTEVEILAATVAKKADSEEVRRIEERLLAQLQEHQESDKASFHEVREGQRDSVTQLSATIRDQF